MDNAAATKPASRAFEQGRLRDSSTEWTNLESPGKQDEVKEWVVCDCAGHVDDKGVLHARRIDLRLPR